MLDQATAERLGKILPTGITLETLSKAITSESEVKLELPEGRFLTAQDESTLTDNIKRKGYDEGKTAGSEITIKELKTKTGLEFEGKDPDKFVSEFKSSILKDAKIEPEKKVKELQASLEKLQSQYTNDIKAKEDALTSLQGRLQQQKTVAQLGSIIPELDNGISKQDAITVFNSLYEVKEDGIYKSGELLKDNLQNPIKLEDAVSSFLTERNWTAAGNGGGRGKDFQGGSGGSDAIPTNRAEYEAYIEGKGYNAAGADARAIRMKMLEADPKAFD